MDKKQIIEKLRRIDDRLSIEFGKNLTGNIGIVIVGGSAVALAGAGNSRKTKDIDVLGTVSEFREVIFEDPDINGGCNSFCQICPFTTKIV